MSKFPTNFHTFNGSINWYNEAYSHESSLIYSLFQWSVPSCMSFDSAFFISTPNLSLCPHLSCPAEPQVRVTRFHRGPVFRGRTFSREQDGSNWLWQLPTCGKGQAITAWLTLLVVSLLLPILKSNISTVYKRFHQKKAGHEKNVVKLFVFGLFKVYL